MASTIHAGPNTAPCSIRPEFPNRARRRVWSGALLDSEILAEVYLELLGGRQTDLGLGAEPVAQSKNTLEPVTRQKALTRPEPLPNRLDAETLARHTQFVGTMKEAVWADYIKEADQA